MAKWSAIPCAEVHSTRREWLDSDGRFRASVRLECAWEDRFKLACDLYTSRYGATLPTDTTGYCPRAYPHVGSSTANDEVTAPLMNKIGVDSVQFANIAECYTTDGDAQVIESKTTVHVDVQYGRHYNIQESIEWDVQAVTQSYQQFQWASNPLVADDLGLLGELEAPVATYSTAILTREFIGLGVNELSGPLSPDIKTLIGCVNCVNQNAYLSNQLGINFKAGTLLMLEPETRPSTDMQNTLDLNNFGGQGFSVKVRFLYKPGSPQVSGNYPDTSIDTHNQFWRARMKKAGSSKRGGWDRLLVKDPGTSSFEEFAPFDPNSLIDQHWLKLGRVPTNVA